MVADKNTPHVRRVRRSGFGRSFLFATALALCATFIAGMRSNVPAAGFCDTKTPTITGTAGDDVLTGTPGPDVIFGLGGNDVIDGLGGDDILCGGDGDDTLRGGDGLDFIYGNAGADILEGQGGDDGLFGGAGDDTLDGGSGNDRLEGEDGNDVLHGGDGDQDELLGGAGDDTIDGGPGAFDRAMFGGAPGPVVVRLAAGTATGEGTDTLIAVESVSGSSFDDDIEGDSGRNSFGVGPGNDTIRGGDGADHLIGGKRPPRRPRGRRHVHSRRHGLRSAG